MGHSSKEYMKEWKDRNPDKVKLYARTYYSKHKDDYYYDGGKI